jgi:hypothetical protein
MKYRHNTQTRLVMAGQDRSGQIIETAAAAFATVALAPRLFLIMTVTDHRMAGTAGTANAIGPTMLTDQLVALVVINERGEVDQFRDSHDDTESVRN